MQTNLFADEIRQRERERRRREPLWSLLSFLLHGALFVVVVLCTPVKELIIPESREKANPAADLPADRIEDIGERLSEVRMNELLAQIQVMQDVLHNIDIMKEQLAKDYDQFAEKTSENVRSELERFVAETAQAQAQTTAAQTEVRRQIEAMVEIETKADLADKQVSEELRQQAQKLQEETCEKTNTAQANAVNALDKLEVKADFAGFKKTAEAAAKFREAQIEAAKQQDASQNESIVTARELAKIADAEKRYKAEDAKMAKAQAKLEENSQLKAKADELAAKAETSIMQASIARDRLKEEKKWEEAKKHQAAIAASHRELDKAKRDSQNAQRRINEAKSAYAHAEKRRSEFADQCEQLAKTRKEKGNVRQLEKLDRASESQRRLNERIETLKAILAADCAQLEKLAQGDAREENKLVDAPAAQMDMNAAYELAKELESAIAESYKDIKATETAIAKKMSFTSAHKITDVAKPARLSADVEALEAKPRTKEALDRQKVAQSEVVREADNMVESTVAMMNEAMEIVFGKDEASELSSKTGPREVKRLEEADLAERSSDQAVAERMAAMEAANDYQLKLADAAAEDASAKAKDLAELMREQQSSAAEEGKAKGFAGGPPGLKSGELSLVPGNVVCLGGEAKNAIPAKWMYINSWHVIGPFPNPNRVNLRRKFAPESKVDLDATYVGKDGRVLKWEFCQAKSCPPPQPWMADWRAEIIPEKKEEYSIYYAYAEVFFDEDCDRWVAIGSDDRSDIWLNDVPIWGSSNKLKAWTLAEDFRRVHFRKGRNRILARIENGHWNCGWSMCISLEDGKVGL